MKYITLLLITFSICLLSVAQKNNHLDQDHENFFRIGAKAGVNINKIQGSSYKDGYNYNYQAGLFLQFNFSNRFGIQPEVSLVQTSTEFSDDNSNIYNDLFRGGTQKNAKLNYLEIPVLLNINVGPSKRVKLQLGPSFGNLLKETVDSLKTPQAFFKKSEVSAIGGLWLQLPVVNIGARYKIGLNNINAIDDKQVWRNQAFQIFIGLSF
ncbi:PorT family protein [Ferruginibacter lapsinanis]|uniref:porin family protein n=1 Tax=Ferruginibacter lapsinanis TaxID=563172 RepID=UPI001E537E2B|nr:porin family protein [Ferruginibacter lapsinanis]UEG49993.1 PorT family protein [Ferruginibacter lapsinanis]